MFKKGSRSLGDEIFLITAIVFIPLSIALVFMTFANVRSAIHRDKNNLVATARTYSAVVDREINSISTTLQALSISSRTSEGPTQRLYDEFVQLSKWQGVDFLLRDASGDTTMSTRVPFGNTISTSRNFEIIDAEARKTGRPQVSNAFIGVITRSPTIQIVEAVQSEPNRRYVIAASLDSRYLSDLIKKFPRENEYTISLVDRKGVFIASEPNYGQLMRDTVSVVWRNRSASEGIFEGEGILGYSILSGYATSALSDWMLIVTAPKSLIYREVLNNLLQTILAIIMALGTTIYIAFYVGKRSRSSASALLLSAQNLKDGEPIVWTDNDVLEFDKVGRALLNAASELRAREQRNSEMLLELSHRTKNLLAVIQSMAKQAAKSATSVEKFGIEFSDRLFALSRCHDLLIASEWQSVCLSSLVQSQVIPVIGEQVKQIKINGPVILLSSAAAQTFAIALHELTTNSIKYGALGTEDGSVEISWDVSDQTLNFKWDEKTQNDSTKLLDKQGFGTVVLLRTTPAGLSGTSMQEIFKGGYLWQVSAPLSAISAEQVTA